MDTDPENHRVQALWWAADRAHRAMLAGPQEAMQTLTQNPSDGRADAEAGTRENAAGASSGPNADTNTGLMEGGAILKEGPLRELRGALELLAMVAAKRPEIVGDRLSLLLKVRPAVGGMRGSPPATNQLGTCALRDCRESASGHSLLHASACGKVIGPYAKSLTLLMTGGRSTHPSCPCFAPYNKHLLAIRAGSVSAWAIHTLSRAHAVQVGFCTQHPDAALARAAAAALRSLGAAANPPPPAELQPALRVLVGVLLQPHRGEVANPSPALGSSLPAADGAEPGCAGRGSGQETGEGVGSGAGIEKGLPESGWYGVAEEAVAALYALHLHPAQLAAAVLERLAAAALGPLGGSSFRNVWAHGSLALLFGKPVLGL